MSTHRRSVKILLVIQAVFVFALAFSLICFAATEDVDAKIASIESSIKRLQAQIGDNSAEIAAVNSDVQEIDAALAALEADMSQYATPDMVKAEIAALRDELTNTLKSYVDQKIKTLNNSVQQNSADVAELNADMSNLEATVSAMQSNMSKYATDDKISTEISVLRKELTDTLKSYIDQQNKKLKEDVEENSADVAAVKARIDALNSALTTLKTNMSQYATTSGVQTEISTLRKELTDTLKSYVDEKIEDLSWDVRYNTADIAAIKANVTVINDALATLKSNMSEYATTSSVQTEISVLRKELTDTLQSYIDQKIKELNGLVEKNTTDIAAVKKSVDALSEALSALEANMSAYATDEEMNTAMSGLKMDVTATLKGYVDQKIKDLYQNSTGDLDIAVIVYRIDTLEEAIDLLEANMPNYATNEALDAEIAALKAEFEDLIDREISALSERVRINELKIKELSERNSNQALTLAIIGIVIGGIGTALSVSIGVIFILNRAKKR